MSKQLAISAAFSTFAMAACALFAVPAAVEAGNGNAGAPNHEAPAMASLPGSPALELPVD